MPPPRGIGASCNERSLGRSSTAAWRNSGISAQVPSAAINPAPAVTATSAGSQFIGLALLATGIAQLLRLAPHCPADRRAAGPGRAAQYNLLGLLHVAGAKIDALPEAHLGA